ncbi:carbamoyltransferase HypF [Amycolatopsis minnesotensis]|uniref:Carbamoyltransferase n=1 Tax=Amycolatopsis minnesotensis TaxID=337894 RepID=A0ABN2QT62_9PSEU
MSGHVRKEVRVEGVVQGVGFRPFVHGLANRFGLGGRVGNDAAGVFVEVEGASARVDDFLVALREQAPPLAGIERLVVTVAAPRGVREFVIARSDGSGRPDTLVPADSATCADCLRELFDPADRRYRYAFLNCTNCGPRFTIVTGVPYDRAATTMAGFAMCVDCAAEYRDPADRRFHAQPVCCPRCGPRLSLRTADGTAVPGDVVAEAAELVAAGAVLAVKGLGGYHLAADATSDTATAALRARKHREDKPFAVLVSTVEQAAELVRLDDVGAGLLTGTRRPIVLLDRLPGAAVAAAVAPGADRLGILLPYTPLHHLLSRACAKPLVLTSGNVSDEPIAYRDEDAMARLSGIADAFLTHDRPIRTRTDDSVVTVSLGRPSLVRRSRGYVPEPVSLAKGVPVPVLGCGAELKNTFCLAKGRHAFVSHHIGDLENYETLRSFTEGIDHFGRLFDITPAIVAHDLHPEYLSTKYALERTGVALVGVQHHHAHIAACLADNGVAGPVLGVAFDGLGYGTDGTIWGGEFLVADLAGFHRAAYLEPVRMPGGTAAIRQPWRMAASYVDVVFDGDVPMGLGVRERHAKDWDPVVAMARGAVNAPRTSSAGRLFDAVSALLGVRDLANYEGQAAIELQRCAEVTERGAYRARIEGADPLVVRGTDLVREAVEDLRRGIAAGVIAARFHNGLAAVVAEVCGRLRERTGLAEVALSGGVFQNDLLLRRTVDLLSRTGFDVLTHSRVPTNDGGVSLGQVAVAGCS